MDSPCCGKGGIKSLMACGIADECQGDAGDLPSALAPQIMGVTADQVCQQYPLINRDKMCGVDDAGHGRAIILYRGGQIVEPVRGRIKPLERATAVNPFAGRDSSDQRSDRTIVDYYLIAEQGAIG